MKDVGVTKNFWDGTAWQVLPKGFVLADSNNFAVGFYQQGAAFTCQYGGAWPEAFTAWNTDAPAVKKKLTDWGRTIGKTWTGVFDLKRKECKSGRKECCRYSITVEATFANQGAFATGTLIVADGDIRSNDSWATRT